MFDGASDGFGAWNLILSAYGGSEALHVPADYASDGFGSWNRILY